MAVQMSGVLKDGAGKPIQNCTIQLKAKRNSTTVVVNTVARKTGKSYTASSLRILQGLIAAKVVGCSGAI